MSEHRRELTTAEPGAWRARGTYEDYRGHRIFVMDEGDAGQPLLCLHGFPTSSWDWHRIWPQLVTRFRVVAPDFIGFGFSAKPRDYAYSIIDQADLVETVLARRGFDRVHVLAHDIGDTVAQELLARQRERGGDLLASVTLLNGGLFPETHRPVAVQKLLLSRAGPVVSRLVNRRAFDRSFAAIFGTHTKPSQEDLRHWWSIVSSDHGTRISHLLIRYMHERREHRQRWVGALQQATVPIRVIDGVLDPVSGGHMVDRYRELVAGADVVELRHVGHYPQVEDPEATLNAFLAGPVGTRS